MKIKFTIVAEPKKAVSRVWLALEQFAGNQDSSSRSSKVEHMLVIQVKLVTLSRSFIVMFTPKQKYLTTTFYT